MNVTLVVDVWQEEKQGLSLPMLMLDGYDLLLLSIAVAVQRRPPPVEFNLVARLERKEGGQNLIFFLYFFGGMVQ